MDHSGSKPPADLPDWLPRLQPGFYRGHSAVHWQMTADRRATGWLTPAFHSACRELLTHTLARYELVCPAYCLMPDHMHLIWMCVTETSDQRKAAKFFRQHANKLLDRSLPGTRLQKQAYDHVLRQKERGPDAIRAMAWYLMQNPVRAGLAKRAEDWFFLGCLVPGYPNLHPLEAGYWDKFWKLKALLVEQKHSPAQAHRGETPHP